MENKVIVTESASNMRAIARQMLKGNWKVGAIATLIYLVAINVPTMIIQVVLGSTPLASGLTMVYTLLVGGALVFGVTSLMLAIHRGKKSGATEVFSGFEQYGRAFCIYLLMMIFILLWSIPTIVLVIAGSAAMAGAVFGGSVGVGILAVILWIAAVVALILPIRASFAYSQCFFVAIDNPEIGALGVFKVSKALMNGNKWKYFCLDLSFIGWAVLCMIPCFVIVFVAMVVMIMPELMASINDPTFTPMQTEELSSSTTLIISLGMFIGSIGYLWLMPYMMVTHAGFYEILIGKLKITQADATSYGTESSASEPISISTPQNTIEQISLTEELKSEEPTLEIAVDQTETKEQ